MLALLLVPAAVPAVAQDEQGWDVETTVPDPMDDLGSLEPADGKWLKGEDGREYFVKEVKKVRGTYAYEGKDKIRYKHWFLFDLDHETADAFFIKIYKPAERAPGSSPEEKAKEREAKLAEIAATYKLDVGESDRITFKPFDRGLPRREMWRNGFDIADMNGDGHPDIVHGPARKGAPIPHIFLGDGAGNWKQWSEVRYPRSPYDYGDAAAADFNGDGLMDLAFGFHLRGVLAMVQQSPGVFVRWSDGLDLAVPGAGSDASGFSSRAIETADWNGDGRPDILALGEGPRPAGTKSNKDADTGMLPTQSFGLVVFLNQGDGTWKRDAGGDHRKGVFGDALAHGDVNGDGHMDVVTASNLLGVRDVLYLGHDDNSWSQDKLDAARPSAYLESVAIADFDGDGRDDVAIGYASWEMKMWRTGLDILLAREGGTWQRKSIFLDESRLSLWALATGDIDGDGHADVVTATGKGDMIVFLGDGAGNFTREASPEMRSPHGCRGYAVRLHDLDGDGRDEVVAAFAGEGSALPMPEFPETCKSGGAIVAWRADVGAPAGAQEAESTKAP
ncbi:MAG: VCBS repeat-containing protein [Acidobacteria bacterium]|nr:VCBS repeat-containing protein [Acidobacteriota bacterium]